MNGAIILGVDTSVAEYAWTRRQGKIVTAGIAVHFDIGDLVVANPFVLRCDSGERVDPVSLAGCRVTDYYVTDSELVITFDGRISLSVSLREEDFLGSESAVWRPASGDSVVFR